MTKPKFQKPPDMPEQMSGLEFLPTAQQRDLQELFAACNEIETRSKAALKVYRPLPFQDRFHKCKARECILQKANRAGGSVAGFVEDARAMLAMDPYRKYPHKGKIVVVGYGEKHIGTNIHRLLFRPGAFRIIRDLDPKTKHWRAFRPWPENMQFDGMYGDDGREEEACDAPPLIPAKYILEDFAWTDRRQRIFSRVVIGRKEKGIETEWELLACNSNGDPNQLQGMDVNLYHIDEDLADEGWYTEAFARTNVPYSQRQGGFIRWTALPQGENDAMMNLIQEAERQEGEENPRVVVIRATANDNPFYSIHSKKEDEKRWKSMGEDVYRQRFMGDLTLNSVRVYPDFSVDIHNALDTDDEAIPIRKVLAERKGDPPADWTRYITIDPGHQVLAALCWAVPPPEVGEFKVVYDEIYIPQGDANKFGDAMQGKCRDLHFEDFIIDSRGGRLRELGTGKTPREQYSMALRKRGVRCAQHGFGFKDGLDNITAREESMRNWLRLREDGTPTLLVVAERCPNFCREMRNFRKKTRKTAGGQKLTLDEAERKSNTHAVECGEYGAAHGLPYRKPPVNRAGIPLVERILRYKRKLRRLRAAQTGMSEGAIPLAPLGVAK